MYVRFLTAIKNKQKAKSTLHLHISIFFFYVYTISVYIGVNVIFVLFARVLYDIQIPDIKSQRVRVKWRHNGCFVLGLLALLKTCQRPEYKIWRLSLRKNYYFYVLDGWRASTYYLLIRYPDDFSARSENVTWCNIVDSIDLYLVILRINTSCFSQS